MISLNFKKRAITSFLLLFLIYLIISFKLFLIYTLIVLGVLSILEFLNLSKKIIKNRFYKSLSNLLFMIYIFSFCFIFIFFSNFLQLKIILFSLLLGCAASDIGGFIFGKLFKGPKLTKISPNKTIAGSIGSLIFTIFTIVGSIFYFTETFDYIFCFIGLITSLACQLGDLFFSFLKRKADVKDTGNFFPGHGGALDRLDGIFLGLPAGYISLILLF